LAGQRVLGYSCRAGQSGGTALLTLSRHRNRDSESDSEGFRPRYSRLIKENLNVASFDLVLFQEGHRWQKIKLIYGLLHLVPSCLTSVLVGKNEN